MAVIRVSGMLGAGKTTFCKTLADSLKYTYLYTGGVLRDMARERGLEIESFYQQLASDPDLERSVDARQVAIMNQDWVVAEGRMAPFLPCIHPTVNMYLDVDESVAVERLRKRPEHATHSEDEVRTRLRQRLQDERTRYRDLYGIPDHLDRTKFDIVIDTTRLDASKVVFRGLQSLFRKIGFQLLLRHTHE